MAQEYPIKSRSIYAALRERRKRYGMLSEWYGESYASVEIAAHRPAPHPIAELVDALLKTLPDDAVSHAARLHELWPEVAGSQAAAVSAFKELDGETLVIAVSHNAWIRELSTLDKLFLSKLTACWPETPVKAIRFVSGSVKNRR